MCLLHCSFRFRSFEGMSRLQNWLLCWLSLICSILLITDYLISFKFDGMLWARETVCLLILICSVACWLKNILSASIWVITSFKEFVAIHVLVSKSVRKRQNYLLQQRQATGLQLSCANIHTVQVIVQIYTVQKTPANAHWLKVRCKTEWKYTQSQIANIYRQCKSIPALFLLTVLSPSLLASGHPALFEQLLRREKEENFLKLVNPGPGRQVWLWLRWRRRPKQQAEVEAHAGDALVNSGKLPPSWNTLTWGVLRERLSLRDRLPLSCRRGPGSSLISSVRSPHPHNYQLFPCGTSGAKIIRFVSFRDYISEIQDLWVRDFWNLIWMSHRERRLLARQKY